MEGEEGGARVGSSEWSSQLGEVWHEGENELENSSESASESQKSTFVFFILSEEVKNCALASRRRAESRRAPYRRHSCPCYSCVQRAHAVAPRWPTMGLVDFVTQFGLLLRLRAFLALYPNQSRQLIPDESGNGGGVAADGAANSHYDESSNWTQNASFLSDGFGHAVPRGAH